MMHDRTPAFVERTREVHLRSPSWSNIRVCSLTHQQNNHPHQRSTLSTATSNVSCHCYSHRFGTTLTDCLADTTNLQTDLTAVMGCGGSKEDAYHNNGAQVKPAANGAVPQGAYAAPPPPQYQQEGGKKKAVKAGKNLGLLSMLAG